VTRTEKEHTVREDQVEAAEQTEAERTERPAASELRPPPTVAQVRDEDLEPHAGLRYIARLFKGLAVLIAFMLIAEIIIGLQQDGTAAIGLLLVQATRLVVFACFLWGAGDLALMLIESNHDLRATRILLGRVNNKMEIIVDRDMPQDGRVTGRAGEDVAAAEEESRTFERRASRR
jgi:hypothetical protein